jgi:hypothetical protein
MLHRTNRRALDGSGSDRQNGRCPENEAERRQLGTCLVQRERKSDRGDADRDPGEAAEPGEQAAGECEICGGDEWQRDPGRALGNARVLVGALRNHSVC